MSKLLEFVGSVAIANEKEDIDTTVPDIQVTFFEKPTLKDFLYEPTPAAAARKAFALIQMKAFRTGVQLVYHERPMIINAAGFGGHLNFNNTGTQFEWIIISIQPQISAEHRNLYTTSGNEQANHLIKKIEISNIRRKYSRINENIYDLDNFGDQLELFDQFRAYISNMASTKNALDFSVNKECQQAAQRHEYFTNQKSERIYMDMRNTLGFTGRKDSMERDDSAINIKITLCGAAARN